MNKKFDMISIGVPLVEFIKKQMDSPLYERGDYVGPFPAGDPCVVLNTCIALGYTGAYVGVVGKDAFADCFLQKMKERGIDTTYIRVDESAATGISMLAKNSDGSRNFLFTLPSSAAAKLNASDLKPEMLEQAKWIHISGFAISLSDSIADFHHELIKRVGDDVKVSFDPNYRKEVIGIERYKKITAPIFERCNLFLPSAGEALLFGDDTQDELDICRQIARQGKMVAYKQGEKGCHAFLDSQEAQIAAFPAVEVDPTGAGDTFSGALIAALLDGKNFFEAARYGTAAGSIAVTRLGLMDIAPTREELLNLLK